MWTPVDIMRRRWLLKAIEQGNDALARRILKNGCSVCFDEERALRTACEYGRSSIVRLLIEHGADVNVCNGEPLRCALLTSNDDMEMINTVQALIEHGARPLDEMDIEIVKFRAKQSKGRRVSLRTLSRRIDCLNDLIFNPQEDPQHPLDARTERRLARERRREELK